MERANRQFTSKHQMVTAPEPIVQSPFSENVPALAFMGIVASELCNHADQDTDQAPSQKNTPKTSPQNEAVRLRQLASLYALDLPNMATSKQLYYINKRQQIGDKSHGFAAESANTTVDRATGKSARMVGGNNARNGPDCMVDGDFIQTKYCATASRSIDSCFDHKTGLFRYLDNSGKPMKIEVPKDQYSAAVEVLEDRITAGKVPGVKRPSEASRIVKAGHFTYEQACNITKFGTFESITYDFGSGIVTCAPGIGLSAVVVLGMQLSQGVSLEEASKLALCSTVDMTIKVGTASMLSQQLAKTQVVANIGQVFGAEAKSSLLGVSNAGIYMLVFSYRDFLDFFQGSLSGDALAGRLAKSGVVMGVSQLSRLGTEKAISYAVSHGFKFLASATGPLGWAFGMMAGSLAASLLSETPRITERDATQMQLIFISQLQSVSYRYLLTNQEMSDLYADLIGEDPLDILCEMRDDGNPYQYIGCEIFNRLPGHIHRPKLLEA